MSTANLEQKQHILLVEDDAVFRKVVAKNLEFNDFVVEQAENGLVAKNLFYAKPEKYKLIISDIKMPELDGVALLLDVRKISKIPFIVMTGFSEILESQSAFNFGASGFLPKPLRTDSLLDEIHRCLNPGAPARMRKVMKFEKVAITNFQSLNTLPSDIYLSLGQDHFVKVAHKGDAISQERLQVYVKNKVTFLYVAAEDMMKYDAAPSRRAS